MTAATTLDVTVQLGRNTSFTHTPTVRVDLLATSTRWLFARDEHGNDIAIDRRTGDYWQHLFGTWNADGTVEHIVEAHDRVSAEQLRRRVLQRDHERAMHP